MLRQSKDKFYDDFLKEPTKDNFRHFLKENCGEMDEVDFKESWIEKGHLAKTLLAMANSHGGIVAISRERTLPHLTESFVEPVGFYAMIQGIEDPYNFGYALRSLYACGCDGIILPERNWLSAAGVVARSSAGASEMFKIAKSTPESAIDIFKKCGYTVVCADERTENILGKCELKKPILLIVGGEKRGISRSVIDMADIKVKIDYKREFNASLSAASATTMFAYEIMRQN